MPTFNYIPAPGATENIEPRIRRAQFGDGYAQRVADGINNKPRSWSLTFNRATADIDAIAAFLTARGSTESFDWTPPSGAAGKWLCASWSRPEPSRNVHTITATFVETFGE